MANQEQNPPQQEQPFVAAKQVKVNLEDILLTTNNEVALLYPEHTNKETFKCVSDSFPSAALANHSPDPQTLAQIIQCLGGKTRGFDQITNKDAIILYSLANGINIDYASIFWEDIIIKLNKRHREKVVPYTRFLSLLMMHKMKEVFSVNNWALKPNQPEEPPFIDHMLDIRTAAKPVHLTSSKEPLVSSSEATKVGSSEVPTGSKIVHLERKKESSSAMDSNPSQTSASTSVAAEMHKEDQQATGGPTSLGVTSKARSNPKLSSGMSAFNLNEPIYSASLIIHSESASGNDASAVSTAEVDLVKFAPSDFIPQQYGMNEGTKNTSYDHLFAGTDPHVLADKTQSVSEGLEVVLTQPTIGKGVSSIARQIEEDEASRTIKLEDLAKLASNKKADKVHATTNAETEDASVPKSSSHRSSKIQELTNQFNELTEEVKGLKKQVHNLEIEQPRELKEIPTKLEDFTKTVTSLTSQVAELKTLQWELLAEFLSLPTQVKMIQAKLKTLDALPSLLHKVTNALNQFSQAIASKKIEDNSVPSAGQAGTQPAKGEKNTNQATISQLFQRKAAKNANLAKHQSKPTPPPTTPIIPPKDKGKKALSSKEAKKESTDSDYDDDETYVTGSMVESSRIKKVKKFDFVTEDGKHIYLTKEQINQQKKIEEEAKAKAAKHESEVRKEELVDLLGLEVVNKKSPITIKVYKQDGTSEIIPKFKASDLHLGEWKEVMNACPNRTRKGWTTIYDQTRSRMDYIHTTEAELDINLDIPLGKHDPLDKLNDLTNKKRKHADDIDDYFKANRRLKSSVQYEDHLASTVLNELFLGSLVLALQVFRKLGSIFTSVYAADQKLKKAYSLSSKEITHQLSFNHLVIPQARNPETQWTPEERKTANLDQRLKSLIMSVLPDDQMNSVINCLTTKSTWDDLILYHDGDLDILVPATTNVHTAFFFILLSRDLQDKSDDEEDTRSSQELIDVTFDWDEDDMSSDDNEVTKVKDLMALCFVSGGGGGGSVDVVSVVSVTLREHHADASRGYDDLVP
ncbi:hypothetical protein Tco_0322042 [Tanacetum coccineum]